MQPRRMRRLVATLVAESSDIPKVSDLDDAFGVFDDLVKRYRLLLRGHGGPVVPIVLCPWESVLTEPWIPSS